MDILLVVVFGAGITGCILACLEYKFRLKELRDLIQQKERQIQDDRVELAKRREAKWAANGGRTLHNITRSK